MLGKRHPDSELLSAYLDNELPENETIGLQSHLQHCDLCREEFARLQRISRVIRKLPVSRVDSDAAYRELQQKISSRQAAEQAAKPTARRKAVHHSVHHWGKPVAAALMLLLLTAGIIFFTMQPQDGRDLLMAGVVEQEIDNSVAEQEFNEMIKGYDQLQDIHYY